MSAYDNIYLEDAMYRLGDMLEYAQEEIGLDPVLMYRLFLASPIAEAFQRGHPKYVSGLSGYELAGLVITEATDLELPVAQPYPQPPGEAFWAGWSLAYFQWHTGLSFQYIETHGLAIETVLRLFHPLHEADLSQFAAVGLSRIQAWNAQHKPALKTLRKAAGLTQERLAERSGVSLRMIRAYEQGAQDLSKAEAISVQRLSHCLNVPISALIPPLER